MKQSIVTKLWLTIVGIILVVLLILGLILSQLFQDFYYKEESAQLLQYGNTISQVMAGQGDISEKELETLGKFISARVMVIDKDRYIRACNGMMGMRRGMLFENEDIAKVLSGEEITKVGFNENLQQTVLSAAVPVKFNKEIAGAVFLFKPVASIEENLKNIQNIIALAALMSIALATVLAFVLSKTLSYPLISMQHAARKMAAGNFDAHLNVSSSDEIGLLASSLNDLAHKLHNTLQDLRAEKDKLQNVLASMSDFVANVSHELRTPLSIIQSYAEAILDFRDDEALRNKSSQVILDETKRLTALVNDLLILSKAEGEADVLNKEKIQLEEFIGEITEEFLPVCAEKQLKLVTDIAENLPTVNADRSKLKQIMINLLDNACRYGADGKEITVKARVTNGNVKISVIDYGRGIPEEDIPLIWDRFYRVDKSRQRDTGGTGLGLAIVRSIIAAHNGEVSVRSIPHQSTEFSFTLPIN